MNNIKEYFERLVSQGIVPQMPMNYDTASYKMYVAHLEEENSYLKRRLNYYMEKVTKQMTIQEWQKTIHENAKAHGWWENPRTEGELIMLIVSEASEAFEEIRANKGVTETYYGENGKMEGVPSELADIVIRVMDMCEYYGIDLESVIREKHNFNITRPYKHGGKKL